MSGDKDDLITEALETFEGHERKKRKKLFLQLLLGEQRIISNEIWNVYKGSDMGLLHSGDLAAFAYQSRVERGWAAWPLMKEAHGIFKILRFRDDSLVLVSEKETSYRYGRDMINRAGYFIATCEKQLRQH